MNILGKTVVGLATLYWNISLPAKAVELVPDSPSPSVLIAQANTVSFPAAGIKLRQPEGFVPALKFDGFTQESSQSSVMVLKIPGPFSEISKGLTRDNLKTRGIKLKSKKSVQVDGGNEASLLSVTQEAFGTEFSKWILITGDESETLFITATFPSTEKEFLSEDLKATLLDLKIDSSDALVDLGYTFAESSKLQLTQTVGKNSIYTQDGTIPTESIADPIFVAGPAISSLTIVDPKQFALRRLLSSPEIKVEKVLSNEAVTIAGLSGYEILAEGLDESSNTPLSIYQTLLFTEDSYFIMRGSSGRELARDLIPEFQRLARSFSLSPSATAPSFEEEITEFND